MKKFACITISLLMFLFFLLCPDTALAASRRGLSLWFEQLLPTLLPFSILSYVILSSNLFSHTARRRSYAITPEEWYVILCGFLFGFPIGSKLTADLYGQGKLSRTRATSLFVFTNNLSPVFVTTAMQEFLGIRPGFFTYLLLYGIPLLFGVAILLAHPDANPAGQKNTASRFRLDMQIIDAGIINGFETLIKICGYIVLFSLSAEMLRMLPVNLPLLKTVLIGCTEVTTGIAGLAGYPDRNLAYVLGICFLSWGGVSGLFQTASITSRTDLSMSDYLRIRLGFAALATLLAILFCRLGLF